MNELEVLYYNCQLDDLSPRNEFNLQLNEYISKFKYDDPIYVAALADRLAILADRLKESVKDLVPLAMEAATDKNTESFYGDTFTLKKQIEYLYPNDGQLINYDKQIDVVNNKLEPFKVELKALTESIKARQKQLVDNGTAVVKDTKYSFSIKKK